MPTDAEITAAFWKSLRADRTVMLGLDAGRASDLRPMTAQIDGDADHGPIWFFTSTDSELVTTARAEDLAIFTFTAKNHDLFAAVHGHLTRQHDRATIDRLWSPWVAAWYDGKDDPKLALLRFDPARAEIWDSNYGLLAGLKLLFGVDPREDFADRVAKVSLD